MQTARHRHPWWSPQVWRAVSGGVSGGTDPTLVGLLRSGFGIPYPVYTRSGRPLADDMTQVLCNALTSKGFQCVPVLLAASAKPNEIRRKLQEHAGTPALLLVLHEWKSDTHTDTALAYDATLRVLDYSGALMAETRLQGRDVLGGTFWNASSFAHTAVPQTLKKNLEELLNDPAIIAALQTVHGQHAVPQQAEHPPVAPPPPSVPQRTERQPVTSPPPAVPPPVPQQAERQLMAPP